MKKYLFLLICNYGICNAQNFINPSVENWGQINDCGINTPPDNWLDYSNGAAGVDEGSFPMCPTTIPANASNGNTYARSSAVSDTSGEGLFQYVNGFILGKVYLISFDYAGSNLYPGENDVQWHIFINDLDVNHTIYFHSTDAFWTTHYFAFTATSSTYKIGFRAYTYPPNLERGSAAIDNFKIIKDCIFDLNIGNDTTICDGEILLLEASRPNSTYLWQDSSTYSTYLAKREGKYWVKRTSDCGIETDTINIKFIDCAVSLEMPNVFTPNGDGFNDLFLPKVINNVYQANMTIYNRWGVKIFETNNINNGWDGTFKGKQCDSGWYYWTIKFMDFNSNVFLKSGCLSLIE